ncbi:MAG: hypothetical protein NTZ33_15690 [Bacteroidetes bacterium]|nr:hypothetical protein [Bacteroidota bacterium]
MQARQLLLFKTKAGVLVYALVISILTLIFLLGFLQLFLLSNKGKIKLLSEDKKEDILQSGIEYLLAANLKNSDTIFKVNLFDNDEHEQYLEQKQYGIFNIISSSLVWGKDTLKKIVLVANCHKTNQTALFLNPSPFALKIGGDALMEGDVIISTKGIERAYMGGKSYVRDSLVYGNIITSDYQMPELKNEILKINCTNNINSSLAEVLPFSNFLNQSQKRSFNLKTLLLKNKDEIYINKDSISGNCVIQSDKVIRVSKNACLYNIILSAPKIILEDNFKGSLQLIASDTIIIGKNVKLHYPSALFINQLESSTTFTLLEIGDSAVIQGLIISIQNKNGIQKQIISPIITTAFHTEITGQVYSNGNVYHKGLIKGSLVCKQLVDLSSGVNESLLIDGKISKRKLPAFFPEFNITGNKYQKTIMKCLE